MFTLFLQDSAGTGLGILQMPASERLHGIFQQGVSIARRKVFGNEEHVIEYSSFRVANAWLERDASHEMKKSSNRL